MEGTPVQIYVFAPADDYEAQLAPDAWSFVPPDQPQRGAVFTDPASALVAFLETIQWVAGIETLTTVQVIAASPTDAYFEEPYLYCSVIRKDLYHVAHAE